MFPKVLLLAENVFTAYASRTHISELYHTSSRWAGVRRRGLTSHRWSQMVLEEGGGGGREVRRRRVAAVPPLDAAWLPGLRTGGELESKVIIGGVDEGRRRRQGEKGGARRRLDKLQPHIPGLPLANQCISPCFFIFYLAELQKTFIYLAQ